MGNVICTGRNYCTKCSLKHFADQIHLGQHNIVAKSHCKLNIDIQCDTCQLQSVFPGTALICPIFYKDYNGGWGAGTELNKAKVLKRKRMNQIGRAATYLSVNGNI